MARITKQEASAHAAKLMEKRKSELQELTQSLIKEVRLLWSKKHPKIILESFVKHPEYFTNQSIRFVYGLRWDDKGKERKNNEYLSLNGTKKYELSSVDFTPEIIEKEKEITDITRQIYNAEKELTDYIYKLSTPEKIMFVFPELEVKEKVKAVSIINEDLLKWVRK